MIKKTLSLLLAMLITISLVACGDMSEQDDDLSLASNGSSRYSVIVPHGSSDEIFNAALNMTKIAMLELGIKLELYVDSERKVGEYEILVGKTDREIPAELVPSEPLGYTVATHNNSIVMLGGSDNSTIAAIDYFTENYIKGAAKLERDLVYSYLHTYTEISKDGVTVSSLDVSEVESSDIVKALEQACGIPCVKDTSTLTDKTAAHMLKVSVAIDRELPQRTLRLMSKDEKLCILASSSIALDLSAETILRELKAYDKINFTEDTYVDLTYPMQSVTDHCEKYDAYFECETNKSPFEYEVGEEMIFTLHLKCDGETMSAPKLGYKLEFDGAKESVYDSVNGESGEFQIRTSLETPGAVKLYATAMSDFDIELRDVTPFNGGATAAFDAITALVAEPEDFDEFWQSELEKLEAIEPTATLIEDISESYPGYIVKNMKIDCIGRPVSVYISIPENAEPASLELLVGFMGYGVGSSGATTREDKIVMTVNAHSIDNGRDPSYYTEVASTVLYAYGYSTTENSKRDTVYFKDMILRDLQALRYAKTLTEWNGENIQLNGGGQGAYQALAVASLDNDVDYIYASCPWLCDIGGELLGRLDGDRPAYTDALGYYDAINFAKRITCETRIEAGLGDYISPPSGVASLYNAMSAPVTLAFVQGMTQSYTPSVCERFEIAK